MSGRRDLVTSRDYMSKGGDQLQVFITQISGDDLAGSVFRFEVWKAGFEIKDKRVQSGNAYEIRRIFLTFLLDLCEDGWLRKGEASYGHPEHNFFDPGKL